jgi:hypothetical protein
MIKSESVARKFSKESDEKKRRALLVLWRIAKRYRESVRT